MELVTPLARRQPSIRVIAFTSRASGMLRSRIRKSTNAVNFDGSRNIGVSFENLSLKTGSLFNQLPGPGALIRTKSK
jgi:hypothetical protein